MAFSKGNVPWNKGKELSDVYKKKLSISHLGIKRSKESIRKMILTNTGVKRSDASRKKMSLATKGKPHPNGRGPNSHFWKGGVTSLNASARSSIEFSIWRNGVFARDGYTCQKTGIRGGKIHAHHIKNFAQHPELRFAIDNGITLSREAHRLFHKKYGIKNNTRDQLLEFLSGEDLSTPIS